MNPNFFFFIFLSTILITRVFLFLKPTPSPTVWRLRLHHYMFGLGCIVFSWFAKNIVLFAIGLGLFIDELTYILMKGKTHEDNYSRFSLVGTFVFSLLIFFLRNILFEWFI